MVLSIALVLVWGASEQWHIAGVRRRVAHAFRSERRPDSDDHGRGRPR
ncbi:MAG TPA: hypothetical protein VKV21_05280 [Solirubrobacteraceae bacterium]|nr:hypothetical protein [Solirubrobacteraceae bacterium]